MNEYDQALADLQGANDWVHLPRHVWSKNIIVQAHQWYYIISYYCTRVGISNVVYVLAGQSRVGLGQRHS